jgi:hypothetical protein
MRTLAAAAAVVFHMAAVIIPSVTAGIMPVAAVRRIAAEATEITTLAIGTVRTNRCWRHAATFGLKAKS